MAGLIYTFRRFKMEKYFSGLFDTPVMIAAQILGFCAMISSIFCFKEKNRNRLLTWQIIITSLWTLHFILLGSPTGLAINAMQVARSIVFYNKEKHAWARKTVWLYVFIALTVVLGLVTWESPLSILPTIGTIFSTISLWMKKPFHIRLLTYPVSCTWIIYDAFSKSVGGVLNETFVLITITITILTKDLKARKAEKQAGEGETI